VFLYKAALLI